MPNIHLYYRQIELAMSVERNLLQSTIFMFIWELILEQNHSSVSSVVKLFLRVQACTDMWELPMNSFYKNIGLSLNKGNILTHFPPHYWKFFCMSNWWRYLWENFLSKILYLKSIKSESFPWFTGLVMPKNRDWNPKDFNKWRGWKSGPFYAGGMSYLWKTVCNQAQSESTPESSLWRKTICMSCLWKRIQTESSYAETLKCS